MLLAKELFCLILGAWLVESTYRRLARGVFGRPWRVWFFLLAIAGIALAFGLMNVRYLRSPTARVYGVPFVIAGGGFTDGRWVDDGVGLYMPLPFLGDLAFGVAVCMIPLSVLLHFRSRKIQGGSHVA